MLSGGACMAWIQTTPPKPQSAALWKDALAAPGSVSEISTRSPLAAVTLVQVDWAVVGDGVGVALGTALSVTDGVGEGGAVTESVGDGVGVGGVGVGVGVAAGLLRALNAAICAGVQSSLGWPFTSKEQAAFATACAAPAMAGIARGRNQKMIKSANSTISTARPTPRENRAIRRTMPAMSRIRSPQ
jgi:hypothetical protein